MKTFLAALLIIVGMSAAYAGGLMLLHVGDANGNGGSGGSNFILMVDNTSRILQTDNVSKICKAGGC